MGFLSTLVTAFWWIALIGIIAIVVAIRFRRR
jgi:hypothetical protein